MEENAWKEKEIVKKYEAHCTTYPNLEVYRLIFINDDSFLP